MLQKDINVLIGCEESQAVCIEFRKLGFNAFSCDTQECSGGHPEWHLQDDIFNVINSKEWHCGIFFPPCTHLAVSGAAWFNEKKKDGRQQEGIDFFMKIVNCGIKHTAIENPVGVMSNIYRKPTQIIQPYFFGDKSKKTTCLWLNKLPHLKHFSKPDLFNDEITHTKPKLITYKNGKTFSDDAAILFPSPERAKLRSKTYPGIARAMATQWSEYLLTKF
jgi:hypothetical protein